MKKIALFLVSLLLVLEGNAQEKPVKELEKFGHNIICVAISPDGKLIATGGMDNMIHIWDVNSLSILNTFKGHTDWVVSLAFNHDGNFLVSGSKDKTARVWEIRSGSEAGQLKGHEGTVAVVAYSQDGKNIATGCKDGKVRIFDAFGGTVLRSLGGHKGEVSCVSISPDDKFVASSGQDKKLFVFNILDGSIVRSTDAHEDYIRGVAYSPDGKYLATASDDKLIKIWNTSDGTLFKSIKGHSHWVQSLHFSPDSKYLCSGGHDKNASIWNIETGTEVYAIKKQSGVVYDVEFSADGKFLLTTDFSHKAKIWDISKLNIQLPQKEVALRSDGNESKAVSNINSLDLNFDPGAKGKNYLLLIGISKYKYWNQLGNAVKDAQDVKKVLIARYGYEPQDIIEVYDDKATVEGISTAMKELKQKVKVNDNVMIYFSGHGFFNAELDEGYWIPVDARRGKETEYLPNSTLLKYIKAIDSKHTFLVADACFSGSLFAQGHRGYVENVETKKSRWGLTSGSLEYVSDGTTGKNSPFCTYFLKFLESNSKKKVPVSEVIHYVKTSVANNSEQTPIGNPLRNVGDEGGEFIFQAK